MTEQQQAAMRQVLTQPEIPQGWQPIETAPKDGTEVLLWPGIRLKVDGITPCAVGRWLIE